MLAEEFEALQSIFSDEHIVLTYEEDKPVVLFKNSNPQFIIRFILQIDYPLTY